MIPSGYGNCTLEAITPEMRWREDGETFDPTPLQYRKYGIPVEIESDDGKIGTSFMTWWKPSWRDVLLLMRGGMVRVTVNYCAAGPMDVDITNEAGGAPGRLLEW